jgi:hypothetical protein
MLGRRKEGEVWNKNAVAGGCCTNDDENMLILTPLTDSSTRAPNNALEIVLKLKVKNKKTPKRKGRRGSMK